MCANAQCGVLPAWIQCLTMQDTRQCNFLPSLRTSIMSFNVAVSGLPMDLFVFMLT